MGKKAITTAKNLKRELDKIDREIGEKVKDKVYGSVFAVQIGMWEKGQAIGGRVGGVTPEEINWSELHRDTGRDRKDLKRWYLIWLKCPDKDKYLGIAEEIAKAQTDNWFKKMQALGNGHKQKALPEVINEDTRVNEFLKCLSQHYFYRKDWGDLEPVTIWIEQCKPCMKTALCRQVVSVIHEYFRRWDKKHKESKE